MARVLNSMRIDVTLRKTSNHLFSTAKGVHSVRIVAEEEVLLSIFIRSVKDEVHAGFFCLIVVRVKFKLTDDLDLLVRKGGVGSVCKL